ncbi:MAG: glycerol kinase [Rhodospirillales bacterium]|nr:glycerol kinase [Rhodospirillales bacterium]
MRVAAIDQGTTSTRCIVIETGGRWHLSGARTHTQHHPQPGWVEHDPEELLNNIRALLRGAGQVDAIGIANQGESCLAWDAQSGVAFSPVIVWQDARTGPALQAMDATAHARAKELSGLPLDAYFSASKLGWILRHSEAARAAHAAGRLRLGTTDAFFLDRLCGVFATDAATASRTGLLDLPRGVWSDELCALHGVPVSALPPILPVDHGFGAIEGVPVKASIVDQQAALYGHGCRQPGDTKITFGTGAFLLTLCGTTPVHSPALLPTIAWRQSGRASEYALEGGVYDAGAALEWAHRLGLYGDVVELGAFEGPSALSRGLVFVPALSGLAAPYWDREAAPLFIGMRHDTGRRDMIRAVLEGIALLTAGLIGEAAAAMPLTRGISIDGGLSQSAYFAQFLASAAGVEIRVPAMHELTAIGLAELCGVDCGQIRAAGAVFQPDASVPEALRTRFTEALARARGWHGG